MKEKLKNFARKKRYSIPSALLLVALLVALNARGGGDAAFETRAAARADVAQVVSVTGSVKSASAVDLAFERGGKLGSVSVNVGDQVSEGQTLAVISNADLNAELRVRRSALERERIKLAEIRGDMSGGRSSSSVRSAETTLSNARFALVDKINDAFAKADDAVRNHADRLFSNPETSPSFGITVKSGNTTYNIDTSDTSLGVDITTGRRNTEEILDDWVTVSGSLSNDAVMDRSREAERDLLVVQKLLNDVSLAINSLDSSDQEASAIYSGYRTDISTARSSVNAALTSLRSAMQAFEAAKTSLEVAQQPGSSEEIAIQQSNVSSAEAQVEAVLADISKTVIVAPVSGIITKVDAEVGEIVGANVPVVSLIAESELEIEVNIPEADIAKVRSGADAEVTFDAYGSDFVVNARVLSIDPAETVIDGVPTYRAILGFSEADERIKSGMTANVDIKGERRENVVAVPQRAIVTRDGERIVRVLEGEAVVERKVEVGLRGSDGVVEILGGVSEGELVVTSGEKE